MSFLSGVLDLKHGCGNDFWCQDVERRWMYHHGGMDSGKRTSLEEKDFPSCIPYFFCGRADYSDCNTSRVGRLGGCDTCSDSRRSDYVMATGMANSWKRIVLSANAYVKRAVSGCRRECGREIANSSLHFKTGFSQNFRYPLCCFCFLEAHLGIGMDLMAQLEDT
jgi:hypothetical protein